MAKLELTETDLKLKLSAVEKILALSPDLSFSAGQILGAWNANKTKFGFIGFRIGTSIPLLYLAGTWVKPKQKTFLIWRAGQNLLALNITGHKYSRVLIGVDDADAWADKINDAIASC